MKMMPAHVPMPRKVPTGRSGRLLLGGFVMLIGVAAVATASAVVMRHEPVATQALAAETADAPQAAAVVQPKEIAPQEVKTAGTVAKPFAGEPSADESSADNPSTSKPIAGESPATADAGPRLALPKQSARFAGDETPVDDMLDPETTAAIPPADAPDVEVAETEADVVAMETQLASADADAFALPEQTEAGDIPMSEARVLQWVNMRAAPDQDAEILTVVPADETIPAEAGCEGWCAVTYDGKPGYIYESFLRY